MTQITQLSTQYLTQIVPYPSWSAYSTSLNIIPRRPSGKITSTGYQPSLPCRNTDTFTLFTRLPPELRIEIWELCILDIPRRIVEFCIQVDFTSGQPTLEPANLSFPALLSVNSKSRELPLPPYIQSCALDAGPSKRKLHLSSPTKKQMSTSHN